MLYDHLSRDLGSRISVSPDPYVGLEAGILFLKIYYTVLRNWLVYVVDRGYVRRISISTLRNRNELVSSIAV